MDSELLDYKNELHLDIDITAEVERVFSDTAFFSIVAELLEEASVLDDVQDVFYLDSNKGQRIDGYSWNLWKVRFAESLHFYHLIERRTRG